jgi:hypothetical protein
MTTAAPTSNSHDLAQSLETFTVNVCARAVDVVARRWSLTIASAFMLGALLSLRAAVHSAMSAVELLRRMMTTAHHHRLHHHIQRIAVGHHDELAHVHHLALVGTRQLANSVLSHPLQPVVILVGAALFVGAILFVLFLRGGIQAGSPQDGDGAFGLVTVALGLFAFCALVLVLHGVVAAPILTVTHSIVGSVINAA